ncbi:cyclic nucleotide-binding domain containing protein, partial [Reticulomyxa filosa]
IEKNRNWQVITKLRSRIQGKIGGKNTLNYVKDITRKNEKRSCNDECWKCGGHSHKQKDCMKNKEENEVNVIEEQTNNDRKLDSYVLPVVSLDNALKSPDAMQIQVQTKELSVLRKLGYQLKQETSSFEYKATDEMVDYDDNENLESLLLNQKNRNNENDSREHRNISNDAPQEEERNKNIQMLENQMIKLRQKY